MTDTRPIPLAQIFANPDQPRKTFHPEGLRELADSIKAQGLHQPITVRPVGTRFEIVMGERRFRAHKLLGLDAIECHVREMSDRERDIAAVIENLQRTNISPMEEAHAFKRLVDTGMTVEEVATSLGLAAFRVKWRISLLNLTPAVAALVDQGHLTRQQALEVARVPQDRQGKIVQLINRGQLVGWKATRDAATAIAEGRTQMDIFGEDAPRATEADVKAVSAMEAKIERVVAMAAGGWRDGECIIAAKVDPGRATLMADKLAALQSALRTMERELRNSAAQAVAVLPILEAAE